MDAVEVIAHSIDEWGWFKTYEHEGETCHVFNNFPKQHERYQKKIMEQARAVIAALEREGYKIERGK